MNLPLIQINQIDNGYVVNLSPDMKNFNAKIDPNQQTIVKHACSYSEVCEIIKSKFPPTSVDVSGIVVKN